MRATMAALAQLDEPVPEKQRARILINSLDRVKFEPFLQALTLAPPSEKTFAKLQSRLRAMRSSRLAADDASTKTEAAFLAHGESHENANTGGDSELRSRFRGNCWNCLERGHMRRHCTKPRVRRGEDVTGEKKAVKWADEPKATKTAAMAHKEDAPPPLSGYPSDSDSDGSAWYTGQANMAIKNREGFVFDSGSTNTTHTPSVPSNYRAFPSPHKINLAGKGRSIETLRTGTLPFVESTTGRSFPLLDVHHTPEIADNLLSGPQLADRGYTSVLRPCGGIIIPDEVVAALLKTIEDQGIPLARKDGYWVLEGQSVDASAFATRATRSLYSWHCALGHVGRKRLLKMARDGLSMASISDPDAPLRCAACEKAKSHRQPFPKRSETREETPLALVHVDLAGPFPVQSDRGARYYLVIVDDATRHVWVEFLRRKTDAFDSFKEWRTYTERRLGKRLGGVRSDRGGEFVNDEFEAYLRDEGIHHQLTMARAPEQNGIAERANRTIKEHARAMMLAGHLADNLADNLWPYAVFETVRQGNRSSSASLGGGTPYEALWKKKPGVSGEHPFGCRAWVHVPKEDREKGVLPPNVLEGWYLGHAVRSKGYRVLVRRNGAPSVIESRDVVFWDDVTEEKEDDDGFAFEEDGSEHGTDEERGEEQGGPDGRDNSPPGDDAPLVPNPDRSPSADPTPPTPNNVDPANHDSPEPPHVDDEPASDDEATPPPHSPSPEPEPPVTRALAKRRAAEVRARQEKAEREYLERTSRAGRKPPGYWAGKVSMMARKLAREPPRNRAEAMAHGDEWAEWEAAEGREDEAVDAAGTFEAVGAAEVKAAVAQGEKILPLQYVYAYKYHPDGSIRAHKARLVARGDLQKVGEHFNPDEVYSPTSSFDGLRLIISEAALHDLELEAADASSAYLNAVLKESILARRLGGQVVRLVKVLYGLRQAGRRWYDTLDGYLVSLGFEHLDSEWGIYRHGREHILLSVYVDDFLVAYSKTSSWPEIKRQLWSRFKMTGGDDASFVLGIAIQRDRTAGTITLSSPSYVDKMLEIAGLTSCNPAQAPMKEGVHLQKDGAPLSSITKPFYQAMVGRLMWLAASTRPDLATAAGILGQFSSDPKEEHAAALKLVLRYLRKATHLGIVFGGRSLQHLGIDERRLVGFTDADWSNDPNTSRSRGGFLFMRNGPVSWASRKQTLVSLSSTEAEYIALAEAARQAIYLDELMIHLRLDTHRPVPIYTDNEGAEKLTLNPAYHARTKHIRRRFHFARELVQAGELEVLHLPGTKMVADVLTKPLGPVLHWRHVETMGVVRLSSEGGC
ncbi:hypothetical protein JCM5296_000531 [Sporobolomyces johnsonii]